MQEGILLQVDRLRVEFGSGSDRAIAVRDVSFTLRRGQTLGIVGESGSGKSVTALAVMGLLPPGGAIVEGEIWFDSNGQATNLRQMSREQLRRIRGKRIAAVFQEPMTSLNPLFKCGEQVIEAIRAHESVSRAEAKARTLRLFEEVRLPDPEAACDRYPHELSGGQLQRVTIAMAMSGNPDILIADEPTTALDVTVQAAILDLLAQLQRERGMAILFITHDLGIIARLADTVAVMYRGSIVECEPPATLFRQPTHPYTRGLIACRPQPEIRLRYLPTVSDFMTEADGTAIATEGEGGDRPREVVTSEEMAARLASLHAQEPLLRVSNLRVEYPLRNVFGFTRRYFVAVNNVSFDVYPGETLGLVGESGCGKTTLGRAILRLTSPSAGSIWFDGQDVLSLRGKDLQRLRRDMQIVFQDPFGSLNPRMTVGNAIAEPMEIHNLGGNRTQRKQRVAYLLDRVGLSPSAANRYPHEFSGGQRQRICIARALALNPKLLIADESVSALDVSVQAQVLNLLKELQAEFGLTYIFISHDLSVVKFMSDRIMVMNAGRVEEIGAADDIYQRPTRPYTQALIGAIPKLDALMPSP